MPEIESLLLGRGPGSAMLRQLVQRLLAVDRLQQHLQAAIEAGHGALNFDDILARMRVTVEVNERELEHIPKHGPLLVVANHPFGLLEGPVLGSILLRRRWDVKFLANRVLALAPALRDAVIPVDVDAGPQAVRRNWRALRDGLRWLRQGGALVVLPAGEVAAWRLSAFKVTEPAWSRAAGWLASRAGAPTVPVFLEGANGPGFHLAGLIHPRLRTALLPHEFLNKQGRRVRLSIGRPIPAERLRKLPEKQSADYLHCCTQLLGVARKRPKLGFPRLGSRQKALSQRVPANVLAAEFESLPQKARLLESANQWVCVAAGSEIPHLLQEIGVLREIAFRQAHEGTGRPCDLDPFDPYYLHLFIWNAAQREIVGAYRLLGSDCGRPLYTATLFRIQPEFFSTLGPAIELGRSFIQPVYQKSYSALWLLWRGIGEYVNRNPRYRYLFGPVSISTAYTEASRALIAEYLRRSTQGLELSGLVRPVRRLGASRRSALWLRRLASQIDDLEELSEVVAALEPDGKGLPVLLRQHLQLGAQVLEFSVDRSFSGVLDGLIVLDLAAVEPAVLARYLGREAARRYLAHHGRAFAESRPQPL